jgi:spore coat protein U-like protein
MRHAALFLLALPAAASAETSKSFQVSAEVVRGCVLATDADGTLGTIALGQVAGAGGATASATLVSSAGAGLVIECTPGVTASLTADPGSNPATGGVRQLSAGGAGRVPYQLFLDGASTPWTTQGVPFAFSSGATRRVVPVLARATLTGPTAAGRYTATVRVTLSW